MYSRDKLSRDQNYKPRKSERRQPPSFSSSLLDEIYRSIDGNAEKSDDFKGSKEKISRRQSSGGGGGGGGRGYEDIASARRASLVEKWMEKEAYEKSVAKKRQQFLQDSDIKALHDNDLTFFSSTSSSSDSSGALSSSDTEFFASTAARSKPKVSCFTSRPKPVRTGHSKDGCGFKNNDDRTKCDGNRAVDDDLIKSKSRALKIYAHLKKVKQPISPGGRLTAFINSLFSNASGKKKKSSRNPDASRGFLDVKSPASVREELLPSACSSASSFSRSCLSKHSPRSREKMRSGPPRTVRFEPVTVIMDEDLRPCGHKSVCGGDSSRLGLGLGRPPLAPPSGLAKLKLNKKVECSNKRNDVFFNEIEDEEDDDECFSDSSSDLFELDHLAMFGSDRYSEELPVYETTHFNTNRAIASGLIR